MADLTETLDLLRRVDTPTVCNAIEVIDGKRGFDAFTRGRVLASDPAGVMVGRARTARISAVRPAQEPPEVIRARRMDYYRHMASGQGPRIAVVEDIDPAPVGAYWGELNTAVHKGFGMAGALTNGVMRDLGDLASGFPVLAGHVGPSHAFVHVTEVACRVEIFGLGIAPDDWLHADPHGAVVIADHCLPELPAAIAKMQRTERIVLDAARAPDFDFDRFEAAWTAFEAART
ncbi:RraA family protein [Sagittula sp. S175]|uniref:RraA family protein n=1 Tax=Sagittula sp. S175 TaxID=3415129 RepID=UPI003C7B7E3E